MMRRLMNLRVGVRLGAAFGVLAVLLVTVSEITTAIKQIAAAGDRMNVSIADVAYVAEQASASSQQVSASTEQTSASTEQIAAGAQEIARTADELRALVDRFTLR
jgi:methyl-accepting chemotaxis protein